MTEDIVSRLRAETENKLHMHGLMLEAANEIERLRNIPGKVVIIRKEIRPKRSIETGQIKIADCINAAIIEGGVPRSALFGTSRGREIAYPRMVAGYLARRHTLQGYLQIGRALNLDHTSVMHACKRVPILIERHPAVKALVERCEARLTARPV